MGLFGLTLKKIEGFGDNIWHDLTGSNAPQSHAPAPNFTTQPGGGYQSSPQAQFIPTARAPVPVAPPQPPPQAAMIQPPAPPKRKVSYTTPFDRRGDIVNPKPTGTVSAPEVQSSPVETDIGNVIGTLAGGAASFPKNLFNTAITDPIREEAATLTNNKVALKNARQASNNDNPFTPAGQFAQRVAVAITTPAAEAEARKQADYARKILDDNTGDPVHNNQVDTYASAVENELLNQQMNRGGFDQNTKISDIAKDVGGKAVGTVGALTMGDLASPGKALDGTEAHLRVQSGQTNDILDGIIKHTDNGIKPDEVTPEPTVETAPDSVEQKYGKNVEMVPTEELERFAEHDRAALPLMTAEQYAALKDDIAKNGIQEPLTLNYHAGDRTAYLGEGNHRLAIAKQLGIKELPVDVSGVQSKSLSGKDVKVPGREPDQNGYVPSNQKPSDIGIKVSQPSTETQPTPPAAPVPRGVAPVRTGIKVVDDAIDGVMNLYHTKANYGGTIDNTLEMTRNQERLATRVSARLGAAIRKSLTKEENQAVDDYLDGNPTKELTPTALKVANALRPLHDLGFNVRQSIKPDIGYVSKGYSPRIAKETLTRAVGNSVDSVKQRISSMYGLNLESGMSEHRNIDKFVGSKGQMIGTPKKLGLTPQGNGGRYVDANGNHFIRTHATKQDLEDNGFGPYVRSASGTTHLYHSDTLGLKARADAVNELKAHPNDHGLYTQDQVDAGVVPAGVREIVGVKGLEGVYATPRDAKAAQSSLGFDGHATPLTLRAIDTVSNLVTQAIVLNPAFHGANQLVQTAIAAGNLPGLKGIPGHGILSVAYHIATANEEDMRAVIKAGAGGTDYGANRVSLLAEATGGLTKVNAKTMAAIELRLRAGLFKASKEAGMSDKAAAANINKFLGSTKHVNEVAQRTVLFAHYFRTMVGAMGEQISHPIAQRGSIANTAFVAGLITAASYEWKKFTGNENANIRYPGEVGLGKELIKAATDAAHGDPSGAESLATNRVNPVIKETVQQTTNKDLFTGQKVTDTPAVRTRGGDRVIPAGRGGHAIQNLLAPSQQIKQGASGARTPWEIVANELGLRTPHATGYQAAPSGPLQGALNGPDTIVSAKGDPTGYKQQQTYFTGIKDLTQKYGNDKNATDTLNLYFDRNHDPATGASIKMSPSTKLEVSGALATNPDLLSDLQKFEQSQDNHDPKWDLPFDELRYKMTYDAMLEGGPERAFMLQQANDGSGNWLKDLNAKESDYYNNLPSNPYSTAPEDNPNTPPYPKFDATTQGLLDQYDQETDPAKKSALIQSHGADLATAWASIAQWQNQQRLAQSGPDTPQNKLYPEASPKVQGIIAAYNAIPKGGGKYGGNLYRAQWIQSHPNDYAAMQNYLAQATMWTLEKDASVDRFQGSQPSQQELKDIAEVGKYDIASTKDAKGNTNYAVNPPAASASFASSTGSGSKTSASYTKLSNAFTKYRNEVKLASQGRDAEHASKAGRSLVKGVQRNAKLKGPKRMNVHMRGQTKVKPFKVKGATLATRHINRAAAKPQKALQKNNHAKLKT